MRLTASRTLPSMSRWRDQWKEKTSATAFGGLNRLTNKLEDKAVTGATGYEQNIDPEGAGYKKQATLDTIKLTDGKVRIKM